jgi:hypothetical protein
MGYWKQKEAEYEEQEHVATRIAIDAGAIGDRSGAAGKGRPRGIQS